MTKTKREQVIKEIQELKEELRDREAALPAHSVRPHQVQVIEELEEKIVALEKKLENMPED
jgi:chromosome segregation ATPase